MLSADVKDGKVCLGVAVDHRLRPLFREAVSSSPHPHAGAHILLLENLGLMTTRNGQYLPLEEIDVTVGLLGPDQTGGVVFLLQQPSNTHSYHQGTQYVIEQSPTLRALAEIWRVVTKGSEGLSILDRLPFVRHSDQLKDENELEQIQKRSMEVLDRKSPDVVVCMWQRKQIRKDGVKDKPKRFKVYESRGVGRSFRYATVRNRSAKGTTKRVNAFHPSYAMNYHPEHSCLRQLLILEAAKAWGLSQGTWKRDKKWMSRLRYQCQTLASNNATLKPSLSSGWKDVHSVFDTCMTKIGEFVRDQRVLFPTSPVRLYQAILGSGVITAVNDASLCAALIHRKCQGPRTKHSKKLEIRRLQMVERALALYKRFPDVGGLSQPCSDFSMNKIADDLGFFLFLFHTHLGEVVLPDYVPPKALGIVRPKDELSKLSKIFLEFAVNLEDICASIKDCASHMGSTQSELTAGMTLLTI